MRVNRQQVIINRVFAPHRYWPCSFRIRRGVADRLVWWLHPYLGVASSLAGLVDSQVYDYVCPRVLYDGK